MGQHYDQIASARRVLWVHSILYIVGSVFFVLIDLLTEDDYTSPGHFDWSYWPVMGWGLGVIAHLFAIQTLERHLALQQAATPPPAIVIANNGAATIADAASSDA